MKLLKKKNTQEDLVSLVKKDYENRLKERKRFEAQWQLNSNFLAGNQHCIINVLGEMDERDRDYYWQEREVYNHIASIVETRLAKLNKVRPKMSVRPQSGSDGDIKCASVATKILNSTYARLDLDSVLAQGTNWSEVAGSVFYKVWWDNNLGKVRGYKDGKPIKEGEIRIDVCPPYEIFPSSITCADIESCSSIIHAKAVSVERIEELYGAVVESEKIDTITHDGISISGGLGSKSARIKGERKEKKGHAMVIERYTRPTKDLPKGELVIVAGNKLLYNGELPFRCGDDGEYSLPFIKQDAIEIAGCFFGCSMIERAIPIQRAYNAVKNRKHEFMNRIAMGVLAVEDGSVDIENLESEGLSPGKILVYRQGAAVPTFMNPGHIPSDFDREEDKLLSEFIMISGVSEIMRSSSVPSSVTSGVALQLLAEQDETRLSSTASRIRFAVKKMAKLIIRLYRQFAVMPRLSRCVGEEGEIELVHWRGASLSCDDVIFETENELNDSMPARKNMVFDLLKMGLLHDENGKLSDTMRFKILDMLGYGAWEYAKDQQRLHLTRAEKENSIIGDKQIEVRDIDDHKIHIAEHARFMLCADFEKMADKNPQLEARLSQHIGQHKDALIQDGAMAESIIKNESAE